MPASTAPLKFKCQVNAPASEAFRAFTRATALREWFANEIQSDPHKGGRLYAWWTNGYYMAGEFTALEPGKRVAFTWQGKDEPESSRVVVTLTAKDSTTTVTVTHSGLGSGKAWAKTRAELTRGWELGLENLQSILETGHDLRFTLRPMLGINIGEFTPEIAARLGVPVTEGLRLDGVVERMGAERAGLQRDDVLIRMGGKKILSYVSLVAALDGRRAGDNVEVIFYRGTEKKSTTMELSRRPLPEIPPTPDGLAEALRKIYTELLPELEAHFDGVTEAEASHRPAPGEWNAKEVVAHLIAGERDTHYWITGLATDQESETFPGNLTARNTAIVAAHPTVRDMLNGMRQATDETVALIAALPPEFVAHKGSFWRLGHNVLQPAYHMREHFKQITDAIASARK